MWYAANWAGCGCFFLYMGWAIHSAMLDSGPTAVAATFQNNAPASYLRAAWLQARYRGYLNPKNAAFRRQSVCRAQRQVPPPGAIQGLLRSVDG